MRLNLISTIQNDDFHFETNEAFFAYDVYLKVCHQSKQYI